MEPLIPADDYWTEFDQMAVDDTPRKVKLTRSERRELRAKLPDTAICPDCGQEFEVWCRSDVCIDCLTEQGGAN